jgi:hypothetical protein
MMTRSTARGFITMWSERWKTYECASFLAHRLIEDVVHTDLALEDLRYALASAENDPLSRPTSYPTIA